MPSLGKFIEEPGTYTKISMPKGIILNYINDMVKQQKEIKKARETFQDQIKSNPGLASFFDKREEFLMQKQSIIDSYNNKRDNYDDFGLNDRENGHIL